MSGKTLSVRLDRAGPTAIEATVEAAPGEISTLNNRAAVTVNGVRDKLRVLLVSGQPHPGERAWRNLLKSDAAVDLVHFTILRPPEKEELTPLRELSLIVFPVQELFDRRLYDFDLVVFDRFVARGVLAPEYLSRVADYLRRGGAVLVAAGPEFAGPQSLYYTALGEALAAVPTGAIVEQAFRPRVSDLGQRHPVTSALPGERVSGDADADEAGGGPAWGRWFRLIETDVGRGSVLLEGPDGRALLVVDQVGEGRLAQLASDQIWLWGRGFDGGGPQGELSRRLVHWLMKEPELEEERLSGSFADGRLRIERRTLGTEPITATVTSPTGAQQSVVLEPGADGVARAEVEAGEAGLYRIEDPAQATWAAAGAVGSARTRRPPRNRRRACAGCGGERRRHRLAARRPARASATCSRGRAAPGATGWACAATTPTPSPACAKFPCCRHCWCWRRCWHRWRRPGGAKAADAGRRPAIVVLLATIKFPSAVCRRRPRHQLDG